MNGFERRKEQKKESIRRAALELFKFYGFEKVTINDIARSASVSQVTIYNHFGSKEELVREVHKTLLQSLLDKYRTIIKGEGTFLEKSELIFFDKIEMLSQYQGEFTQKMIRVDPEIRQFIDYTWWQEVNQLTVDLLDEGKREGYIDSKLSQEALMVYYEILRRGILASSSLVNTARNKKLIRDLMTLFRYGLMGKTEHP
jgi:TetR/AcrR family transcriptional regulator, cholesterol catabolism regulator